MRGDCLTLARRGLEVHCGISGKRGHEKARLWAGLKSLGQYTNKGKDAFCSLAPILSGYDHNGLNHKNYPLGTP